MLPESIRRLWINTRASRRVRRADWNRHPPVLIYQMGKVGSTTVYEALAGSGAPFSIYHVRSAEQRDSGLGVHG